MRRWVGIGAFVAAIALAGGAAATGGAPALTVKQIAIPGGGVSDLAAGPGGIWFSSLTAKQAGRVTPAGGVKQFALPITSLDNSAGGNNIAVGSDGNVWLTGKTDAGYVVVRIKASGAATVFDLQMPEAPGKDAVAALGSGRKGPLWFGVWWNRAGSITTGGSLSAGVGAAEGFPGTAAAVAWAADRSGAMWFVYGRGYGRVAGGKVTTWEPKDGRKHEFRDITLGPDGNMWVADNNNAAKLGVGRIAKDGTLREFRLAGGPWSITAGPDGNLWVSLPYLGVARVTPKGVATTYRNVGPNPSGIASGLGKIWLVTGNAGFIARIDPPR